KMGIDDFIVSGGKFSQLIKKHWKNVSPPELPFGVEYKENLYIIKYCHDKVKVRQLILELCQDRVLYNYVTKDFVIDGQKIELDQFSYYIEEKFKIKFLREEQLFFTFRYAVRSFSPVALYLNSLLEENPDYIDEYIRKTLLITNPLEIKMMRKKLIATYALGIAEEKVPIKDDTALILKGPQGIGKSSLLKILASPDFFCDNIYNFLDKDERIKAHKFWIIEWQELETVLGRRETSLVKSILSTQEDHLRKPYARVDERMIRHFSIWGTTNQNEFLSDNTGNRRFRIVNVDKNIDLEYAHINRDKLWAAVKAAYLSGEKWWFDAKEESKIENENFQYTIKDRDLGETIAPVLADLLSQGLETISISSLKFQDLLEKKLLEFGSSVNLNLKALKHYMENLDCVYRKSLVGKEQGKRGYIISATSKVMDLISSFGYSIKSHNKDKSQIVKSLDKKADMADVSLVINETCHFSNPETESNTADMALMAPIFTNFSINEKEKNEEIENPIENQIEIPEKIDSKAEKEDEETLIYYQVGDYVRDISGGPREDQPQPELIYIV
ncbi:MAG: VapE family protein, partial [Trichodesmium sp. St19_bin1]|nr:VapE family protein [Trichodesmium sp. St19_bin1]